MSIATFFTPKIRNGIIHLIVLIIAYQFLIQSSYRFQASRTLEIYNNSTLIFFFYIHSLLMLPLLIKKKNLKKYLLLIFVCYILVTIAGSWLRASHSSLIIVHKDGTSPDPLEFFFRKDWVVGYAGSLLPSFISIGILSFIYYIIIHNIKNFLPYLEIIVNGFILSIIYAFIIIIPEMGSPEFILFCIVLMVFYSNTFWITPILIKDQNKLKYFIFLIVLSSSYYFLLMLSLKVPQFMQETGNPFSVENKSELIILSLIILFITLFLSFLYGYIRLKIKSKEKVLTQKLGAKDSELQLLKSQVNPHFLFNTLNILYATALEEKATKTAEITAKLASLIRYMQEDINKDFIPLENEIKYLQDYITIQKLRCAVTPQIETEFVNIKNHRISPGLLIPFVENAFKYGIDPSKPSTLKVSVICNKSTIHFECVNSFNENYKTYQKEQGFGIGIKNAKQRLALIYPKKHTFEIIKRNNIFLVNISINTK